MWVILLYIIGSALIAWIGYLIATKKPNDWKVVYTSREGVNMYRTYGGQRIKDSEFVDYVTCILLYSISRDKYKIKSKGASSSIDEETTRPYQNCLNKQIELQNDSKIISHT